MLVVVAGLATTRLAGPWADAVGDALYAALVVLLVRWARPDRPSWWHGTVGLAVCWAVELAQLTDLPAAAVRAVPVLRYLLGTTFGATDLVAYAVGASVCAAAVALARGWAWRWD